jgi:hypothetical protein
MNSEFRLKWRLLQEFLLFGLLSARGDNAPIRIGVTAVLGPMISSTEVRGGKFVVQ